LTEAIKEVLCLEGISKELRLQDQVIIVYCDSQSAIFIDPKVKHTMRGQSTLS